MAEKQYFYLDSSVLLAPDFYRELEKLSKIPGVRFLLDTAVYREIEDYKVLGKAEDAATLTAFVNLLATPGVAAQVDTAGGFDSAPLLPMAAKKLTVLTNRRQIADHFADLTGNVTFLRFCSGATEPFPAEPGENEPAFYLERDVYVNQFDIDSLDYVFSPRYGYLKLDKSKAFSGGEGVCYRTYNGLLCKLYFKKHITYVNFKKLQRMAEMGCTCKTIMWPLDILYYRNQFVGYVMEELHDTRSVDDLRDDGFSGFSILDRFYIVRNFLRNVEYLHARGILVGDMKLDNILVGADKSVYIIDAGSFQVEDYACDVCHKEYTEKLYVGNELKQILRTEKEEYFPINKIIFEILMQKGPFYSKENTEIDGDGSREFTYPADLSGLDPKTMPYHLKMWFALSPAMRQFFTRYFTERKVTYVTEWLRELDIYILAKERAASARRASANP